jgi:hypothetical protein
MRLLCLLAAGLAFGASPCGAAGPARPGTPSPLLLIPAEADLLLEVKDPRRLADLVRKLDLVGRLQAFPVVKEQLASTQARRGQQLLAWVERKLGRAWPELLGQLAGGGAALGVKFAPGNAPFVLVLQGRDEKLAQRFLELAVAVARDELARQESKERVVQGEHHGVRGYRIGKDLHLGRLGAALVLSNKKEAMAKAIDLHLGKGNKSLATLPAVARGEKLLPPAPLANLWVNLGPLQQSEPGKALYKTPRDNGPLTVLFGEYLDVLGRAPFACAGLHPKKDGFLFTLRAPRGRDGMGPEKELHLPPAGTEGSRPLLEPKDVLYSSSFYLDASRIWKDRARLFPKAQADSLAAFEKTSGRILGGVKLGALLESAGAHHRVVVVRHRSGYQKKPGQVIPSFAFVTELRQPEKFSRNMDTLLRAGALLATTQVGLKLREETHNGREIVGYRFDEKAELKADVDDIRFNFSPCYARVDDQFVFCSTIELCRELVDLLALEKKSARKGSKARATDRFYAAGFAGLLDGFQDQLITQTILDQAAAPGEAKEQVQAFIKLVAGLGVLTSSNHFEEGSFRYDFRLRTGK